MDIQNLISEFHTWLKGLGDGEATLYGIILTGFIAILGWLIKKIRQRNSKIGSPEQNRANGGSIAAGEIKNSTVRITNQNIKINKVKASNKGVAVGVNITQNEKQDERDGK